MAFDLSAESSEMKKAPEVKETLETQPAQIQAASNREAEVYEVPAQAEALPTVPHEVPAQQVVQVSDPLYSKVENILADKQIFELYKTLPAQKQPVFKAEGEKLARAITHDIRVRKFRPHRALAGTRKWLGMVDAKFPYLLQKAKTELDEFSKIDEAVDRGEEIIL